MANTITSERAEHLAARTATFTRVDRCGNPNDLFTARQAANVLGTRTTAACRHTAGQPRTRRGMPRGRLRRRGTGAQYETSPTAAHCGTPRGASPVPVPPGHRTPTIRGYALPSTCSSRTNAVATVASRNRGWSPVWTPLRRPNAAPMVARSNALTSTACDNQQLSCLPVGGVGSDNHGFSAARGCGCHCDHVVSPLTTKAKRRLAPWLACRLGISQCIGQLIAAARQTTAPVSRNRPT